MSVIAYNLASNEEIHFDDNTTPEYAVCYGYYQDLNRLSWFFSKIHDNDLNWKESAPLIYGEISVACGDWVAHKFPV